MKKQKTRNKKKKERLPRLSFLHTLIEQYCKTLFFQVQKEIPFHKRLLHYVNLQSWLNVDISIFNMEMIFFIYFIYLHFFRFVQAAVSLAVVIPCLLELQEQHYGVKKGIPTLVMAAASFDNVLCISAFGICLGIAFGSGKK